jgi:hypothetical protein
MIKHWTPIPSVVKHWSDVCTAKAYSQVLEIGPGTTPFPAATAQLDVVSCARQGVETFMIDIDRECIPKPDNHFDFVYCRHVLEDIQNPDFAFADITRAATSGYLETPSPLVECTRGVDAVTGSSLFCGYHHHRYIVWTQSEDNSLHFLPKLPLLEHLVVGVAEAHSLDLQQSRFWNNYYMWDASRPAKCVIYKHGVNFTIMSDYVNLLNRAVEQSRIATMLFFENIDK